MTRHYTIGGFGTEPWLDSDRDAVSQRFAEPVCGGAIDRHCTPPALLFLPFKRPAPGPQKRAHCPTKDKKYKKIPVN